MSKKEREIALEILNERSERRFVKDIYLLKMKQYPNLNAVQKAFIKRLVQGVAEREFTLDYYIRANSAIRLKKIDKSVLNILRLSVYQILYLDKIPVYSVVNEAVKLVKKAKQFRKAAFTNAVLHKVAENKENILKDIPCLKDRNPSVAYSFPQEIIDILREEYAEDAVRKIMEHSLKEQPIPLRFLRRDDAAKERISEFLKRKESHIVGKGTLFEDVYYYFGNIESEPVFREGDVLIQDESSMLVGYLASVDKPKLIYDLCAAPGGKSMHLASLLPNSRIIASDLNSDKAAKISENKERLKMNNVEITVQDACEYDIRKQEAADCVIVDVPCSGLGVIASKPDIKYRISKQSIEELMQIQSRILEQACKYVKPGGILLYSTCTITSLENRNRIKQFMKKHPEFEICDVSRDAIFQSESARQWIERGEVSWQDGMLQILPQTLHGFFIAKLRKRL